MMNERTKPMLQVTGEEAILKTRPLRLCSTHATGLFQTLSTKFHWIDNVLDCCQEGELVER